MQDEQTHELMVLLSPTAKTEQRNQPGLSKVVTMLPTFLTFWGDVRRIYAYRLSFKLIELIYSVKGLVTPWFFRAIHHGDEHWLHLSHAIPAQLCAWSGTEWDHWESCTAAIWGRTHPCQVFRVTSQLAEMLPTSYIPLESRCKFILPWKPD